MYGFNQLHNNNHEWYDQHNAILQKKFTSIVLCISSDNNIEDGTLQGSKTFIITLSSTVTIATLVITITPVIVVAVFIKRNKISTFCKFFSIGSCY